MSGYSEWYKKMFSPQGHNKKMKFCWHQYDTFKSFKNADAFSYHIERTTKTCRKCGKTKIKEKVK